MTSLLHHKVYPAIEQITQTPPLLILHGLLGSMDNWRTQAKRLSHSRTVVTIDLRNHGHSPHRKGMSYKQMASDVIELIHHHNVKKIHLLGHSMGGKVAMWLALHYPLLVTQLIVVDIAPKTYPLWHQNILMAMQTAPLSSFQSRQQVDQYFVQFIEDATERAFLSKNLQRQATGGYQWRCNLAEIIKSYLKIATFPTPQLTYSHAALFIRGANSHYIMPNDAALIATLFPYYQLHTINNAGHLPHNEQPNEFYQRVIAFLN
ncbi:MAG: alpha/beta fold hydrolase [Cocleimonas sp.]|nr:alpha/beta fold hydrolase [Cocleimonas sp.]